MQSFKIDKVTLYAGVVKYFVVLDVLFRVYLMNQLFVKFFLSLEDHGEIQN